MLSRTDSRPSGRSFDPTTRQRSCDAFSVARTVSMFPPTAGSRPVFAVARAICLPCAGRMPGYPLPMNLRPHLLAILRAIRPALDRAFVASAELPAARNLVPIRYP